MSSVWDGIPAPQSTHYRMAVGEIIIGDVDQIAMIPDPFGGDDDVLAVTIGGRQIIPHRALHDELRSMNVQPGDTVRVERTADRPIGGGKRMAQFTVQRKQDTTPPATSPAEQPRTPSW